MAANVRNSVSSLKGVPFSRRSNSEKLALKQSGPPNLPSFLQRRDLLHPRIFNKLVRKKKSWLAGFEEANAVPHNPTLYILSIVLSLNLWWHHAFSVHIVNSSLQTYGGIMPSVCILYIVLCKPMLASCLQCVLNSHKGCTYYIHILSYLSKCILD